MRIVVRHWLIRGLILTGIAALVIAGWVTNSWVSPERVREQVIATLSEHFEGVEVHVGTARLRILGGIAIRDLKLTRRGAAAESPFFSAPSAVVYHDKEQINRGRLVIRKIELENPELHLERTAEGRLDLVDVIRPSPADQPIPTFVAKGGTLVITDRSPNGLPPVRLTEARLSLLNDPLPVLTVTADAASQGFGPVQVRARLNRVTRQATVGLELPAFPLGGVAAVFADRLAPEVAPYLNKFTATAAISADLAYNADGPSPGWRHDVRVEVKDGRLEHPDLPGPVEKIAVRVRASDGRVRVEEATAKIGPAQVRVAMETRSLIGREMPAGGALADAPADALAQMEEHVRKLDVSVSGVPLDDALFARLGEAGEKARRMFSPTGTISLGYKFVREATGWKREIEVRPQSVAVTCEKFKYPVSDVRGLIKKTVTHAGTNEVSVNLWGKAGGVVTVKGQVTGTGPDPAVNLEMAGTDISIDDKLIAALPEKYADLIRQFRAAGRADFTARFVQQAGVNLCENEFRVEVRNATLNYTQFPYPLEQVKGRVVVRVSATDPARPVRLGEPVHATGNERDELILDGFTGTHGGAAVWLHGSKRAVPGSRDRKLVLHIGGNSCPVDDDLKAAFAELKLAEFWASFAPRGNLTFAADVDILDRAAHPSRPHEEQPFNPASDLDLTFNFYGPTVTPSFFPYDVSELSGWLQYKEGKLQLAHFAGRHDDTRLKLAAGEVRFYPDGAVWANLGGLEAKPLVADAAFLQAVPAKLRSAFEGLKLKGGAELMVKHMVVLTPANPPLDAALPPDPQPIAPAAEAPVNGESPFVGSSFGPRAAESRTPALPVRPRVARGQAPSSPAAPSASPPTRPDPVVYWDAEVKLAGASLDTGIAWEDLFGAIGCRGRYEGTHLGLLRGNIWLDRAVIARQPVESVTSHVRAAAQQADPNRPGQYLPTELEFVNVGGNLFHGAVGGEGRVVLAEVPRYEIWLTAAEVQLDEVARHYRLASDSDLKGKAQAKIRLYNRPDPKTGTWTMEGAGKIDVPSGRMYNLPVLLDLLKVLKLQAPDKTAFEEGHATFRIAGDRVKIEQIDLIGKAVCVGGWGEVDTSGEYVRMDFYTLGSEILARLVNTPVGDVSALVSRSLFKIRMTRENGILKYKPEPVPVVTEPVRAVMDRLKIRMRPVGK